MKAWLTQKRTWAFAALGLLAIGLAVARQIEHGRHLATKRQLAQTIQAKQVVETKLSAEQQRSQQLAAALEVKTKEVDQVVKRLEAEAHTVQQLQGRLAQMESQINQLQGELVLAMRDREAFAQHGQGGPKAGDVELEKIMVSARKSGPVGGKIIQVNTEWQFVVVDLGWDRLSVGDVLGVYRGEQLIAKIQVERVQEQVAAARVLPEYQTAEIVVEDRVTEL